MAVIAPFRGLRYNNLKIHRLEDVVTPPYDVINEQAHKIFLQKNPYNMIQLDLSKSLKKENLTPERYLQASTVFADWQKNEILIRDPGPAFYLYQITYKISAGRTRTRKGFVALVELSEFGKGIVKPHEKTFAAVTADRLELIRTCRAQFSKIFGCYSDPDSAVMNCLEQGCNASDPIMQVEDQDGCIHSLYKIDDQDILTRVSALFTEKAIYIADGHHRYTTSLNYRDQMEKTDGPLPADHPARFVMMYLCPMEDEGLSILPTHRLVRLPRGKGAPEQIGDLSIDALLEKFAEYFTIEEISNGSREVLIAEVLNRMDENFHQQRQEGRTTMFGFYHTPSDRCFLLELKKGMMKKIFGERHPEALRKLDVVVLSDLVLKHCLTLSPEKIEENDLIAYYPDPDEALDRAVKEASGDENEDSTPVLFLMNFMPVHQVKNVADEGLIMPHKSTYFYPKVLTGMLINKLD